MKNCVNCKFRNKPSLSAPCFECVHDEENRPCWKRKDDCGVVNCPNCQYEHELPEYVIFRAQKGKLDLLCHKCHRTFYIETSIEIIVTDKKAKQ